MARYTDCIEGVQPSVLVSVCSSAHDYTSNFTGIIVHHDDGGWPVAEAESVAVALRGRWQVVRIEVVRAGADVAARTRGRVS